MGKNGISRDRHSEKGREIPRSNVDFYLLRTLRRHDDDPREADLLQRPLQSSGISPSGAGKTGAGSEKMNDTAARKKNFDNWDDDGPPVLYHPEGNTTQIMHQYCVATADEPREFVSRVKTGGYRANGTQKPHWIEVSRKASERMATKDRAAIEEVWRSAKARRPDRNWQVHRRQISYATRTADAA